MAECAVFMFMCGVRCQLVLVAHGCSPAGMVTPAAAAVASAFGVQHAACSVPSCGRLYEASLLLAGLLMCHCTHGSAWLSPPVCRPFAACCCGLQRPSSCLARLVCGGGQCPHVWLRHPAVQPGVLQEGSQGRQQQLQPVVQCCMLVCAPVLAQMLSRHCCSRVRRQGQSVPDRAALGHSPPPAAVPQLMCQLVKGSAWQGALGYCIYHTCGRAAADVH
jgi:hypothetical protein